MAALSALVVDLVITAFWPIIGHAGIAYYSGSLFMAASMAVGLAALSPWLFRRGSWRAIFSRRAGPTLAAMGCLSGLAMVIYNEALAYTTPANASIVAQVEVLYSAIMCALILKERVTRAQSAASLLIVAGTGLILARDLSSPRWRGDLMIAATPWMFQISHILSKRLPKDMDAVTISGGRIFFSLTAMIPLALWTLGHGGRWSWSAPALGILVVQGLGISCVNFVLWYTALARIDVAKATAIILAYPALTVLFSWALGREIIHATQLAGLVVTLAGAYWMSRLVLKAQAHAGLHIEPEAAASV